MSAALLALLSFGLDVGDQVPDREGSFAVSGVLGAVGLPVGGEEEERRGCGNCGDVREHGEHSAGPSALITVGAFSRRRRETSSRVVAAASKSSASKWPAPTW
jgi:hypothetical protein